jgi:hypothetical protein
VIGIERTIAVKAEAKSMTLTELARFVSECMRQNIAADAIPTARVNFGGGIKSIAVRGESVFPADSDLDGRDL